MQKLIRILLPITIPTTKDYWSIEGLCLLRESRAAIKDDEGNKLFQVSARNRNRMLREMMQFLTKFGCWLWVLATVKLKMTGGELRLLKGGRGILTAESAEDTEEEWNRGDNSLKAVRLCVSCANYVYICRKVLGVLKNDKDADRAIVRGAIGRTRSLN